MDPHEYEGKVLTIEGVDQEIPKFSEWKPICSCCNLKLAYFPKIKSYFINQWEVNLTYPLIVLFLFIASFVAGIFMTIETFKGIPMILVLVLFSLCFILWLWSFLMAMFRSPGYLPFYWAVERRESYTYEEQMDGVVTNDSQFAFAQGNERPERATFSMHARRLVIRADHVCKWISNWVGYNNYRFFYLQLFWTFWIYIVFFVIIIFDVIDMTKSYKTTAGRIMLFILILPDLGFFLFFIKIFIRHNRYLFNNQTTLGQFKMKTKEDKHNYYDIGCCNNIEETCGSCSYCPLYLLPVPIPRINDGFSWRVNTDNNPNMVKEQPKVTLEYVRACPTIEDYAEKGAECPPYPNENKDENKDKNKDEKVNDENDSQDDHAQDIENVQPADEL